MTTLFDPIQASTAKLRRDAGQSEVRAAAKAVGQSGTTREWAFHRIYRLDGATAVELAYAWAQKNPCYCGCTHQPPIPVNQWGARLGELRDAGVVDYVYNSEGEPVIRSYRGREANVHVLTEPGRREAARRYR